MRRVFLILFALLSVAQPAMASHGLGLAPPVEGRIGRGFEATERYGPGHRGVDWHAPEGSPVRASASGVVHFAGTVAGRSSVSVDHGGVRTTYTPVQPKVKTGQYVDAGEHIGVLQAGHCEDACLHWGLTDGTDYFDPLQYMEQRRVRLVPLGAEPVQPAPLPLLPGPIGAPGTAPVDGRVTSRFGMRLHPITKVWKLHDGVDFGAPCGAPIRSPWAGVVSNRDVSRGYGYRVHVRHPNGVTTAYAHLPRFNVEVGQALAPRQTLGVVGNTGYSTGCHLHWMAWRSGSLIDPLTLLTSS